CTLLFCYHPPTPYVPPFAYTTLFRSLRRRSGPRQRPPPAPAGAGPIPVSAHVQVPPQCARSSTYRAEPPPRPPRAHRRCPSASADRKSTRLNSSHVSISYAVFCLKKK